MRRAVILAPCILNWLVCGIFLLVRPEATALIEERESEQRAGTLTLSSDDPYMLIAGRPLWQWNEWHGGESTWVKAVEVLDGPAVITARHFGDCWAASRAFNGKPTYRRESWIRAYVFIIVSSAQWLLIGALIAHLKRVSRKLRPGR